MSKRRVLIDMDRSLPVGRLLGIPIIVHASWLASVAILSTFTLPAVANQLIPDAAMPVRILVAVLAVLPISACIIAHELGHAVVARSLGLDARHITLFAFGGVSAIFGKVPNPRAEGAVAIAGPAVSVVLATIFTLVARLSEPSVEGITGIAGAYAFVNIALAIFNLVPAFPMDGGRILRSMLWWGTKDRGLATRWAALLGKGLAGGLVVLGLYLVLSPIGDVGRPDGSGLWTAFVGMFIFAAADSAERNESDGSE